MNPITWRLDSSVIRISGLIIATIGFMFILHYYIFNYSISTRQVIIKDFGDLNVLYSMANEKFDTDQDNQKHRFAFSKTIRANAIRDAAKSDRLNNLQMYIVPQVTCPTMVRIGRIGDGGKWICNPWRVPENGCVVYSLGVSSDTSFETELHIASRCRCKFYSVDPGFQDPGLFSKFNGIFLGMAMSKNTDEQNKQISLIDLMKKYRHKKVDILKMDIEGSEYPVLNSFLSETEMNNNKTNVCQFLIEFHFMPGGLEMWLRIFEMLERKGFRIFSKEANMDCVHCYEFSYIHLSCFKQYGLKEDSTYFTYFV